MSGDMLWRKRKVASLDAELRPGERLVVFAAWDVARCECPSTHLYNGIPCIGAAQTGRGEHASMRCLRCDATWLYSAGKRADR